MKKLILTEEHVETITNELIAYARELQQRFEETNDLRALSRWSYQGREAGRNIPYMGIDTTDPDTNRVVLLMARPITTQRLLAAFFNRIAPNTKVLPEYSLYADETGVHFTQRYTTGKDAVISLFPGESK